MFKKIILCLLYFPLLVNAVEKNGFVLSNTLIPTNEIHRGGPPKDGIPAINQPQFITSQQASFLSDDDRILGVSLNGISKAYPIKILNWHEIVNDHFKHQAMVITFCPLCGTGTAFFSNIDKTILTFGVSGLLYNSDVLLYDKQTESLWSQIMNKAISGQNKGKSLTAHPISHTSWKDWQTNHPNTLVLSNKTGFKRDYSKNPYSGYGQTSQTYFPVKNSSKLFQKKEWVLGVTINGQSKAYAFSELTKSSGQIKDNFANQQLIINYNKKAKTASIMNSENKQVVVTLQSYWFAWYAFHPKTEVYQFRSNN